MDLFDIYQHGRMRKTDQRIQMNENVNEHRHRRQRDDLMELGERIDRLLVLNEAIWQLVAEKTDLTDADLLERLAELDEADGVADGRRQATAEACACGAMVNPKAPRCVFCGADAPPRSPFDVL